MGSLAAWGVETMDGLPPIPHTPARHHRAVAPGGEGAAFLHEAAQTRGRIRGHLLREVEAMTLFATESGIGVPQDVLLTLDRACCEMSEAAPSPLGAPTPADGISPTEPPEQIALLAEAHLALTRLVAPARPGTLVLLVDQKRHHAFWNRFGAVPLVREMLGLAVLSLLAMLGIALSPEVNQVNMTKSLLTLQGIPLLVNEMFLVAAAGVGATLTNLKYLDRYISACTYDPRYESSYWSRLVMGLISGVILSQLIFGALISSTPPAGQGSARDVMTSLGQPILALLGGFSADVVHDILTHLMSVIGNLFAGGKQTQRPDPAAPKPAITVAVRP